ncbi:Protein of unknown function [Gryllus bimaculatus]|nr:Protein of unknown function [Gryllus bimaculatus]
MEYKYFINNKKLSFEIINHYFNYLHQFSFLFLRKVCVPLVKIISQNDFINTQSDGLDNNIFLFKNDAESQPLVNEDETSE